MSRSMVFVYVAVPIALVGLVALFLFALRLFKVVKAFGNEVARVSAKLSEAAASLEQASGGPGGQPRVIKPDP